MSMISNRQEKRTSKSAIALPQKLHAASDTAKIPTACTFQGVAPSARKLQKAHGQGNRKQRQKEKRKRLRAIQRQQRQQQRLLSLWRTWNTKKAKASQLVDLAESGHHSFAEGELKALIDDVADARKRYEAAAAKAGEVV